MNKYLIRRFLLFTVALFVNAFGIAFITKALLGTSPITSVTYVLSMFTPYTMGIWTILINLLFVVLELPMMTREDLKSDWRMYLLQIPISFGFGLFIDFSMFMLFWLNPTSYMAQLGVLLIGCVILALGITLEVKANVAMMSGEYIVKTIARRFRWNFGFVKLGFDISLLLSAVLLSVIFMSGIYGVREGTVAAALLVGPIVHFVTPYYRFLDGWINPPKIAGNTVGKTEKRAVIAIAREFGSGGHLLGEMLSKQLGIRLFDKELIQMTAQSSGMDEAYIVKNEQSVPSFWLKCILERCNRERPEMTLSADDLLFVSESKIIEELAQKEPCIIVGRCADYILKNEPGVLKVFCYCSEEQAMKRCINEYGLKQEEAAAAIRQRNRNRIHHYEYYTGRKWGDPHNYDLMINTGTISLEMACELIRNSFRNFDKKDK